MWAAFRKVSSSRSPHADHSASGSTSSGVVLAKKEARRLTQRVRRRRLSWGSIWAKRGSGSAAAASRSLTALAHPWGVPMGLPKICSPSSAMGMPGGTAVGSICEADHAAHLAGLCTRPMAARAEHLPRRPLRPLVGSSQQPLRRRSRPFVACSPCRLCLLVFHRSAAPLCLCLVMHVALRDEFSYPPPPFDGAFAARAWSASSASVVASAEMSSVPAPPSSAPAAPAVRPAAPVADSPAGAEHPVLAQGLADSPAGSAPDLPRPVAASVDPAVPAVLSAAPVPPEPNLAGGSSPQAASAATGGLAPVAGSGETVHSAPGVQTGVAISQQRRPPSPDRRGGRPHSPAPREERESARRRRDSPRRPRSQANWPANRGGHGGWRGGRGRGGGWVYDQPVTMADLQRVVSLEMRRERAGLAGPPSSPQGAPLAAVPPPVAPPAAAPSAAAFPRSASRRFAPPAAGALQPFQALVGPLPVAEVPEATLGQLWRLSEGLRAVHLIQMYGQAGLSRGNSLDDGSRDECLDAADRLAELLAPVLAAPARGGAAGVGQLGTAVRGLRRFSRAGSAADVIAAGTAVVRELHRSLAGLLAVLDADQL
ncbi:unnamed protein product [Closterium sp. Naga37s-1]|nr:unnamed protein product [Closterium sp. Naga37s-1]